MSEIPVRASTPIFFGYVLGAVACMLAMPSFVVLVIVSLAWMNQVETGTAVNANVLPMTLAGGLVFGIGAWMAYKAQSIIDQRRD